MLQLLLLLLDLMRISVQLLLVLLLLLIVLVQKQLWRLTATVEVILAFVVKGRVVRQPRLRLRVCL